MTGLLLCALLAASGADSAVRADSAATRADSSIRTDARADSVAESKLRAAQGAWDKSSSGAAQGAAISGSGLVGAFAQLLAGLGFLALVGAGGFLVVRRARGRDVVRSGGSQLDLLETIPAGPGARISLVRVHDRVVAVAFTGSGVAAVAEFSGVQATEILADAGPGKTAVKDFAASLESLMERFRKQPPGAGSQ